jgi:hypothetical protein
MAVQLVKVTEAHHWDARITMFDGSTARAGQRNDGGRRRDGIGKQCELA